MGVALRPAAALRKVDVVRGEENTQNYCPAAGLIGNSRRIKRP